jgi:hypothetical protein
MYRLLGVPTTVGGKHPGRGWGQQVNADLSLCRNIKNIGTINRRFRILLDIKFTENAIFSIKSFINICF